MTAGPERQLAVRTPDGGFDLETASGRLARVVPADPGWRIEAPDVLDGFVLERGPNGGFVMRSGAGVDPAAWTMPAVGVGNDVGLRYLLLQDGRLFRIVLRPGAAGYALSGWETPGAYMTARPEPRGWMIEATPACSGLRDPNLIRLMLATEALDAEEPL